MLYIVHISDFHLENAELSIKKRDLINAFIDDLNNQSIDKSKCILVLSGDLIDKGGCGFPSLAEAFEKFKSAFFDKIVNEVGIQKERIFFVPGNHDIDRNVANQYIEEGISRDLNDCEKTKNFLISNKSSFCNLEPEKAFKLFEEKFYDGVSLNKKLSYFESCFGFENVGIACLNSSWHSSNEDEKMIVGGYQVESAIDFLKDYEIRIAVMHHSIEDVADFEKDNLKKNLYRYFDILLTGHRHKLDLAFTQNFQGTLLSCQSNASLADFSTETYNNGYSIICFEKNDKATISYRKYLTDLGKFVSNTDVGSDDGCVVLHYPKDNEIQKVNVIEKVLENIRNSKLDDINERLFTYGLDLDIPSRLDDLFVEPILSNEPDSHISTKKTKFFHLDEILSSDKNFVMLGAKESGKTTLLDKLFSEYVGSYDKYKCIPIQLDFQDIADKKLSDYAREYLSISKKDYECLVSDSQKMVLIVDNVSFDDADRIEKLKNYFDETPSCRLICSVNQAIDNLLPMELLSAKISFEPIYIQHFKTNQIKSLIAKWFPNHDNEMKDRVGLLIKNFHTLSLPRTPLAVTLFLWIINKQEATPVNNSILVQMVVENLLEKAHFQNIYQNKFNYQNKERLLAFLAYHMELHGDKERSYRISYSNATSFVDDYLKQKIELSSRKVLEDFEKRGILSIDADDFVKFKFNFLFRYFLSRYIEFSPEFKEYVFQEQHALNYFEELVYYSGLHTDCIPLLELSQKILSDVFDKINIELLSDESKIDKFFNEKPAISSLLNFDRVKEKPSEESIERAYDEELNRIPIKNSIEKRNESLSAPVDKVLKFASLLFKNLEEIDDGKMRRDAYKKILTSSMSMLLLYHDMVVRRYLDNKKVPENFPNNIDFGFFVRMLPYLHQTLMSEWLGTEKTKLIINDKINEDKLNLSMSEYEKYLSIFIYSDIKGKNAPNIYRTFLLSNKYKYIMDMGVMKLVFYYYLRSKSKETDQFLLNLIGDLKRKLSTGKSFDKSKVIYDMQKGRTSFSKRDT